VDYRPYKVIDDRGVRLHIKKFSPYFTLEAGEDSQQNKFKNPTMTSRQD
jgi:hypothetical protein